MHGHTIVKFSVRHVKTCRMLIIFYLFTQFGTSWYWHFQMLLNNTVNSQNYNSVGEREMGSTVILVNHCGKLSVQMKTTQCQCGNGGCSKHWEEVLTVEEGGRSVFLMRHMVLRPVQSIILTTCMKWSRQRGSQRALKMYFTKQQM